MRYMIVHNNLGMGGQEKMISYLANLLVEDHDVTLLLLEKKDKYFEVNKNVMVIECDDMYDVFNKNNFWVNKIREVKNTVRKIREIRQQCKAEIIIAFDDRVTWLTWLSCLFSRTKMIFSQRNDPGDKSKIKNILFRYIYKKSNGVVFQLEEVRNYYKLKGDKYVVIPNPVFGEIRGFNGSKGKKILAAGRFQDRKRFDILIYAFSEVHRIYPEYKLYIFGDGEEREMLEGLVEKLGLNGFLYLPGSKQNVIAENDDAFCFVLSSDAEGMPNILIEAMERGIPCIATDCAPGGARYLLGNNERGLLVKRGSVHELKNAIVEYIKNDKLREEKANSAEVFLIRLKREVIDLKWKKFLGEIYEK